jgi:hypothetical protein
MCEGGPWTASLAWPERSSSSRMNGNPGVVRNCCQSANQLIQVRFSGSKRIRTDEHDSDDGLITCEKPTSRYWNTSEPPTESELRGGIELAGLHELA